MNNLFCNYLIIYLTMFPGVGTDLYFCIDFKYNWCKYMIYKHCIY